MSNLMQVTVPDIGDFADVEIIEVLVTRGEAVSAEQSLVTLETDKAAMEVPAPASGTIGELKVKVGDRVSEGSVLCTLEVQAASGAPIPEAPPVAEPAAPAPTKKADETAEEQRLRRAAEDPYDARHHLPPARQEPGRLAHASPSVRRFAREVGVDLSTVTGTAARGRITKADVKSHVQAVMRDGGAAGGTLPRVPSVDHSKFGPVRIEPLSRVQRIAGPRLHASWVNLPHVTQHDEADITNLEVVRKALKSDAVASGVRLTPLAFLVKAAVHCLREFPRFNASLDDSGQNLIFKEYFHIGFAADTPQGLMVPVIHDADTKDLFAIARELGELSAKAREGKLPATKMRGAGFTISSLGSIGGTAFTPIINAPEVAILGVARAQVRPVWDGSAFQPRTMLPLSLSYDHRVIDGAAAVRFTQALAKRLTACQELVL